MLRGERQVVFVTGEPGIGKTAVVEAFTRRAAAETPDVRIAQGQCIEGYGSKEAYYPMLEAVAGLCRGNDGDSVVQILAAQAPTWLVQFPALLTPDREIGDVLEAIASRSPVIIVLGTFSGSTTRRSIRSRSWRAAERQPR